MQVRVGPAPAPSSTQVTLQRRAHTEEPEEHVEYTSEMLLMLPDEQLYGILVQLGITLPKAWSRDKILDLIMKIAKVATDS